jgi:hypothetical protein
VGDLQGWERKVFNAYYVSRLSKSQRLKRKQKASQASAPRPGLHFTSFLFLFITHTHLRTRKIPTSSRNSKMAEQAADKMKKRKKTFDDVTADEWRTLRDEIAPECDTDDYGIEQDDEPGKRLHTRQSVRD